MRFHLDEPSDGTPPTADSNQPWDLAGGSIASRIRREFMASTHIVTAVEAAGTLKARDTIEVVLDVPLPSA